MDRPFVVRVEAVVAVVERVVVGVGVVEVTSVVEAVPGRHCQYPTYIPSAIVKA